MARALRALGRFKALCATIKVGKVHVLATAAARDAQNGPDFLAEAEGILGQEIELLSGAREAELSALGVISGFHEPDGIVGDLGGGSLELIDIKGARAAPGVSLKIGGLALQDMSGGSLKKAAQAGTDGTAARRAALVPDRATVLRRRRHLACSRPGAHGAAEIIRCG